VAELHGASAVVHGGLAPSSLVLLPGDRRCVLVGLGSGALLQSPGRLVSLRSTGFAAPERARLGEPEPLTRAMDVWSLGAVVFGLANGFAPGCEAAAAKHGWRNIDARAAADFCSILMCDDAAARPSAADALKHPFLRRAAGMS
jgi:serine/threonine protein kinase